jgi:hypothetical protein
MKVLNGCSDAYMHVGEHLGTPIQDAQKLLRRLPGAALYILGMTTL